MPKGYFAATVRAALWKGLKILIGVVIIVGALYSFVWVTGSFTDLTPNGTPLLSPTQFKMTAFTLCGIYSFFVLIGKI